MKSKRDKIHIYNVVLLLGSNNPLISNTLKLLPRQILTLAYKRLKEELYKVSNEYKRFRRGYCYKTKVLRTKPIGEFIEEKENREKVSDFYNQVMVVTTHLSPMKVLKIAQRIESELGRKRESGELLRGEDKKRGKIYSSRSIDIDILRIDKIVIRRSVPDVTILEELKIDSPKLQIPHPQIESRPFVRQLLKEVGDKEIS